MCLKLLTRCLLKEIPIWMFRYEPFAKNWRMCISDFFFLVDVGFCLHLSKIVLLQQKCYVEFFLLLLLLNLGCGIIMTLEWVKSLGSRVLHLDIFQKLKKEAFLWIFSSQIPLQFFFFLCDLPLDSLLFSQILLHPEVEGFLMFWDLLSKMIHNHAALDLDFFNNSTDRKTSHILN